MSLFYSLNYKNLSLAKHVANKISVPEVVITSDFVGENGGISGGGIETWHKIRIIKVDAFNESNNRVLATKNYLTRQKAKNNYAIMKRIKITTLYLQCV